MAFVADPYFTFTVSFIDRDGNTGSTSMKIADTVAAADIVDAFDTTIAAGIGAMSDAVVTGYTLTQSSQDPAYATPAEASDVERKGTFSFRDSGNNPVVVSIPSVKNTLVVDGTQVINTADTAVSTFVNLFITGVLGAVRPISHAGLDVVRLKSAKKVHHKSSKG